MKAMLEPTNVLKEAELMGDFTTRLALTEELKRLSICRYLELLLSRKSRTYRLRLVNGCSRIRKSDFTNSSIANR